MTNVSKPDREAAERAGQGPDPDLNRLLFEEQAAIMRAEAAGDSMLRHGHEAAARDYRTQIDQTSFPVRDPHDFDARRQRLGVEQDDAALRSSSLSVRARGQCSDADLARLQAHCLRMEAELGLLFASGRMGSRYNTYAHRSRLVRQQKQRVSALCSDGPSDDL